MSKNIKRYSAFLLALGLFAGCGGSDNDNGDKQKVDVKKASQDLSNFSDAEKLAYAIAKQNKALDKSEPKQKRSRELLQCQNGGTTDISADLSDYINPITTISYDNCLESGEILNGSMKFEGDETNGKITFVTNFTSTGGDEEVTVKPGSIQHIDEGNWEKIIINIEMTINGITRAGKNLIYKGKELSDGTFIEFPVSGKEKIGDSAYFTVDTSYDASKTPFKSNVNYELLSGLFKYKDNNNHAVELEVTSKDVIEVRVDENADGSFSDDEKSAIDFAK
jgi:hypothetical protein